MAVRVKGSERRKTLVNREDMFLPLNKVGHCEAVAAPTGRGDAKC
jgi:hypothetical protein